MNASIPADTAAVPTGSAASASVTAASTSILTPEQIAQRTAALQAELDNLRTQQVAAERRAIEEKIAQRKATVEKFRLELGASDVNDLIALIRDSARGVVSSTGRASGVRGKPGPVGRRSGPIPKETLAALKAAMEAGITEKEAVDRFHISGPSFWVWKKKWGLTNKGIGGHAKRAQTAKSRSAKRPTKAA